MEFRDDDYNWATILVALPSQIIQIIERGNLIYENQCFVFRSLVYSVAQYAQQWLGPFREEIGMAAPVGEELVRVLKRGMEFVTFCADETSPGVIFIILGSLGQFREIIDDVRRYSQMVNQLISDLIQFAKAVDKVELIDQIKSKVELDCKALHGSLEWAFNRDKLAFSRTLRRASDSLMFRIHNRLRSLLEEGVLQTIDIKDLSFQSNLGEGSFGDVRKFLWCNTISVAVKEFKYSSDFEYELNVYRKMTPDDSAHIVQILGHYRTEEIEGNETFNKGHLVLELMETNLETVIGKNEVTTLQSVDILLQIAKAMKCMHAKDVIYRDLKPPNILLNINKDNSFQIKLADFGISKTNFDTIQSHTEYRGTKMYMAPEMLKGSANYSRKVDVYSFGVVCSQILTSTPTRTLENRYRMGNEPVGLIRDKLKQESLERKIPESLKSLIVGCWEVDAEKRPTFEDICEQLWVIKEKLLIGKADHIQNAMKELGIDYYNFAVRGATFLGALLQLKGSEAAGQKPKRKRPHVALCDTIVGFWKRIKRGT